jgi:cyclopropane-fatty-acyl-phospholipid synthase
MAPTVTRSAITSSLVYELARLLPDVRIETFAQPPVGPDDAPATIQIRDPAAILDILRAPRGLGLARAWVKGTIDVAGDVDLIVSNERITRDLRLARALVTTGLRVLRTTGIGKVFATGPAATEFRGHQPGTHSMESDRQEIDFHYSLPPEFYVRVLGPSMTYSCAIFPTNHDVLEIAQSNKHALIERKLALTESDVLVDIGCGWGGLLNHAKHNIGCEVVGITAARGQFEFLQEFQPAGIQVHLSDYRQMPQIDGVTKVASVGMYEHVGRANSPEFFRRVWDLLPTGGLFLNQSIVRRRGNENFRRGGFIERYIFPNANVLPLEVQLTDMRDTGFVVLSVEHFGEHYVRTLKAWRQNLRNHWDECREIVNESILRAWLIYLSGSITRFQNGVVDLAQVLAKKTG